MGLSRKDLRVHLADRRIKTEQLKRSIIMP